MEHCLAHTDYPIWEVIQNGNGPVSISIDTQGQIKILPPKTAKEILARERERKARTILLMALPEDHLAKFHKITDAKEMWEAIKSRFGGNDESKKMFQSLLSQLEIHGAGGVDSLSFDDLYNNLRVFESDVKGSMHSSSSTHGNVAFLDEFDLEEMDLKWQVALISMRMKKFYKKTGRKLQFDAKKPVGFYKTKVECYSCHKTGHFAREYRSKGNQDSRRRDAWNTGNKDKDNGRRSGKQEDSKALVTLDGEGVDWTGHSEDEQENYALMAYSSSGLDTEEKIRFMKIDLDDKTDVLTYHKKLLAEAEKEKEDLKAKVEKWHNSSKNINILLNSQMSARDKAGLGYGDQLNKGVLSYKNEVFQSVFVSRTSETKNSPVNDRYTEGMHAVPPPMTGIYIPSGPDKEIDDS
ncbi:hypothetical protein Tco_1160686 [Tanacetum coccineum]